MEEQEMRELFWEVHSGNSREGPREFNPQKGHLIFSQIYPPIPGPRTLVVDLGAQTIDLSLLTNGNIIAIGNHPQFLEDLDGSQLVQSGIYILKCRSYPFIIVLGHPEYYPRFGFKRASHSGIRRCGKEFPMRHS